MSAITLRRRPATTAPPANAGGPMPLTSHLIELRDRIIRSAIGVAVATAIAFLFIDQLMNILISLAGTHTIQAIDPTETFATYFKVALSAGIGLSIPILLYQLLRFLSPGLTSGERRAIFVSLPFALILFIGGAAFCYFVLLPSALNFLLGFGDPRILKQISLAKFVGFVSNFLLAVGVAFELPLVLFMLAKIGIVTHKRLAGFRKYAVLLSFVTAAVITPTPDPFNQTIVAVPLYLLYELGLQLSRFARRKTTA